ncbi:hypothetical protein Pcinc_017939 [Petrolisthes cinctipes]|uniref:RRM domain-containing protein n=1 Tax=Petrolisthes cinctipes TaxID=88211 RepID=A0AAE1FP29_PETCI|nr:hypothetical protein Pcinc_017939 [Petrolisthes cinctipes]
MDESNYILEITNIPYSRTQSEVRAFFEQFQNVVEFDMPNFNQDPESHRGIVHITYSSGDSFRRALASNVEALSLDGRVIRLKRVLLPNSHFRPIVSPGHEATHNFHESPPSPQYFQPPPTHLYDERNDNSDGIPNHKRMSTLHLQDINRRRTADPYYILRIPNIPFTRKQSEPGLESWNITGTKQTKLLLETKINRSCEIIGTSPVVWTSSDIPSILSD